MKKAEENNSKIIGDLLNAINPGEAEKIENRMLLAAKIDDAVKAKNWKKSDLAKALDKEPSVITKWLSGTHNFTADTLWDIQRVLGVKLINLDLEQNEQVFVKNYFASTENKTIPYSWWEQLLYSQDLDTIVKTPNIMMGNFSKIMNISHE